MTGRHRDYRDRPGYGYGLGLGFGFPPISLVALLLGFLLYALVKLTGWARRLVWRYRSELAPIGVAGLFAGCGWYLHYTHPGWAVWIAGVTWTVALVLSLLPSRWMPVRRWLPRRIERLYTALCVALGGSWLSAALMAGPGAGPLPGLGVLFTLVTSIPWWAHHRRRARIHVERMLSAWPRIAERLGLDGSDVQSANVNASGLRLRLRLARGQTARQAMAATEGIASGLGARPGSVRVEADPYRADRVVVRVVENDPLAHPIRYPLPGALSIRRPIPLGVTEDGDPLSVLLRGRNVLVGGVTGSGKSGVLNVLLGGLTACPDVVLWGIDLKGGMELMPWMRCLQWLAVEPHQVMKMLTDALVELDRRTAWMTARGQRLWAPSPEHPALLIVVDEWAELPPAAAPLVDSIARRGRSVCVNLLAATQRPTQKAMQGDAVRSQMDVRIGLRVREPRDTDLILGQGHYSAGWRLDALDAPGKLFLSDPEHQTMRMARAYWIPDDAVTALVREHIRYRPRGIPERVDTIPAPPPPYREPQNPASRSSDPRETSARNSDTGPAKETSPKEETDADKARAFIDGLSGKPSEAMNLLLWALIKAGRDGATTKQLQETTELNRATLHRYLRRLEEAGMATQPQYGHWKATDPG
ncbi:FtsK/SpoIIIE domain-containing protein [Cryptosporangium sp. NPDC051539]|uniref:FtsK/SpoIIIE domain-containing protein n=1 Tax=Cryptosporangium sp. NPDC051539 TaxID=3363962 RepID=UPI0037B05266